MKNNIYFRKLLPNALKLGLLIFGIVLVASVVSGYVTFADLIKAITIGVVVSIANHYSDRSIKPRVVKTIDGSMSMFKPTSKVVSNDEEYITLNRHVR